MTGKEKCEMLKEIRKSIAEKNGIEYNPSECTHEGDCLGYCPKCDMEAELLMKELKKKEEAGEVVSINTDVISDFEMLAIEPLEEDDEYKYATDGGINKLVDGFVDWQSEEDTETIIGEMPRPNLSDLKQD